MLVYKIIPLHGIGPVLLGMSRNEVRGVMGEELHSFKKAFWSRNLADAYHKGGFQVFFDKDDRVEFIELSSLDDSFSVVYKGIDVFQTRVDDLIASISQDIHSDPQSPEPGYSYVFLQLGLSLWREFVPEDDNDPEGQYFSTVGIGTRECIKKHITMPSKVI